MKIKEFAHKYSLTFFYTTIILAIILTITLIAVSSCRGGDRFEGRKDMMRGGYDRGGQMMNRQPRQMNNPVNTPIQEMSIEESVQ